MKRKVRLKKKVKRELSLIGILIVGSLCVFWGTNKYSHASDSHVSSEVPLKNNYVYKESVYPKDVYGVPVNNLIVDVNEYSRPGVKRVIKYIVIHETDNFLEGVGAKNHAEYLKENNTEYVSWHYTVDDHEIYHHVPDDEKAYHAGESTGNEYGIGIELCVNEDGDFEKTFVNASKLVAYLLNAYGLDLDAVKTHHDFSGKDCPSSILKNDRLDEFKKDVGRYLE